MLFIFPPPFTGNGMRGVPVKNKGFTLIELIVTMTIIGLLSAMILPVFLHGGLDEGVNTLQSSILSAKTAAVTSRSQCTLLLNADYYTASKLEPCSLTLGYADGTRTVNRLYRLPKYIRFWQYEVAGSAPVSFTTGVVTIYFEPNGITHTTPGIISPQDIVITLKDTKTGTTTSRTIVGNTSQMKK